MPAIQFGPRVVVSVTATGGGDWQVVSTPTGFQGITSALFAENDYIPGFVVFENGTDWEAYDGDATGNFLQISSLTGTVTLTRPSDANIYRSTNSNDRVNAGSGTHTLTLAPSADTWARIWRHINPSWNTFTSGDATPSVAGYALHKTNGTTTITAFDDAETGQEFIVYRSGSDITIQNGANLVLPGGADLTLTAAEPSAIFKEDGGVIRWTGGGLSLQSLATVPNVLAQTELTIASGAVTPTRASHTIDTESDAAADDLDTITLTNFKPGDAFELTAENISRVVTIRNGVDNITTDTGENITLNSYAKSVRFKVNAAGTGVYASRVGGIVDAPALKSGVYNARDVAFGIVGDGDGSGGGTDDTTAIENAINGLEQGEVIVFDRNKDTGLHHFNVSNVKVDNPSAIYCTVRFEKGVRLFGIASTAQDAILELKGAVNQTWENLSITTDGDAGSPSYHGNYECALKLSSQFSGVDGYSVNRATQFIDFIGGQIRNIRRGVVLGDIETESAQASSTLSELTFEGMGFRGVERCVTVNAFNAYVEFSRCMLIAQQFDADSSWWDDSAGYVIRSNEGSIMVTGGEIQRAIADGWTLYGKEIYLDGCATYEGAGRNYFTGMASINNVGNGYFGPRTYPFIQIAPGSVGKLEMIGTRIEKNVAGAGGVNGLIIDASEAPDYDVVVDSDFLDFTLSSSVNHGIVGGRQDIRRLTIRDNTTSSPVERTWRGLSAKPSIWDAAVVDPTGSTMSATLDHTAKGGWTKITGSDVDADIASYTASLPDGFSSAIRFRATGNSVAFRGPSGTDGIYVPEDTDLVLRFRLLRLGLTDVFRVQGQWYDSAGSAVGSTVTYFAGAGIDGASDDPAMSENWKTVCVPIDQPATGVYFAPILNGPTTATNGADVAITGLELLAADKNLAVRLANHPRDNAAATTLAYVRARDASAGSTDVTGDGTYVVVIFESETTDTAGEYNTTTGEWTASSDGFRLFGCSVMLDDLDSDTFERAYIRWKLDGTVVSENRYGPSNITDAGQLTLQISDGYDFTSGDVVTFEVMVQTGTATVDIVGGEVSRLYFAEQPATTPA